MKRALLDRLLATRAAGRAAAVVTDLQTGAQAVVCDGDAAVFGDLELSPAAVEAVVAAIGQDRSGSLDCGGWRLFVRVYSLPVRLVVVGAVHIAKSLVQIAHLAGYQVILVDPRDAFAAQAGFEAATVINAWPQEALASLALDARTAVVTLTHDPKLDDAALQNALASPAFYVGALGSRKTQAARLARLAAAGFGEADLSRIHGPVGLAIGALTPAEIAISILAEMTQVRRQGVDLSLLKRSSGCTG